MFIHASFLAVALVLAVSGYFLHLVVFMGSLLFHEFGHIAAASWMDAEISKVEVWPFGAMAKLERTWQLSPPAETFVAFMGPFNSGLLLFLVSAIERGFLETNRIALGDSYPMLHLLARVNLGLLLINLIPCLPLDGGRVLRSQLALKMGYVEATKKVAALGTYVGAFLSVLGLVGLFAGHNWCESGLIWCSAFAHVWQYCLLLGFLMVWGAYEERSSAISTNFVDMFTRTDRLRQKRAIPVEEILVPGDTKISEVVQKLRPSRYNVVLVAGRHMRVFGKVTETKILEAFLAGKVNLTLKDLCFCDPSSGGYNGR